MTSNTPWRSRALRRGTEGNRDIIRRPNAVTEMTEEHREDDLYFNKSGRRKSRFLIVLAAAKSSCDRVFQD